MLWFANCTFNFIWNTTSIAYGNYILNGFAEPLSEEMDISDNNYTCSNAIHVGVPGDLSSSTQGVYDGICNMRDIEYLILHFNTNPNSSNFNPNADINGDGTCNMVDIQIAILHFDEN